MSHGFPFAQVVMIWELNLKVPHEHVKSLLGWVVNVSTSPWIALDRAKPETPKKNSFMLKAPEKKKTQTHLGGETSNMFGIFTPKIGEDEPILTYIIEICGQGVNTLASIFFKGFGWNHWNSTTNWYNVSSLKRPPFRYQNKSLRCRFLKP